MKQTAHIFLLFWRSSSSSILESKRTSSSNNPPPPPPPPSEEDKTPTAKPHGLGTTTTTNKLTPRLFPPPLRWRPGGFFCLRGNRRERERERDINNSPQHTLTGQPGVSSPGPRQGGYFLNLGFIIYI